VKESPASLRGYWEAALILLYLPVPVRFDFCGLLLALSLTLNTPVLVPLAVGVNVTLIVHLLFGPKLVVHVVAETAKSPVFEITMLLGQFSMRVIADCNTNLRSFPVEGIDLLVASIAQQQRGVTRIQSEPFAKGSPRPADAVKSGNLLDPAV
jgi:hypothetical protein